MIELKNSRILDICTNLDLSNSLRLWIKADKILNRFCDEENIKLSPESQRKHCKSVQRSLDKKKNSGHRPDKLNAWKQDICLRINIELDCVVELEPDSNLVNQSTKRSELKPGRPAKRLRYD